MSDIIQKLGHSVIHHGKENNRIYLMKYNELDGPVLMEQLDKLASQNHYSKIIAKVPSKAVKVFENYGYQQEAHIPKYYNGVESCIFMCKYLDQSCTSLPDEIQELISYAKSKSKKLFLPLLSNDFNLRILTEEDAQNMVDLYKKVFKTYPFPIFNTSYLIKTMNENIIYFGIYKNKQLIGIASSETDPEYLNCEMTDFAILPEFRGNNYSVLLLKEMEQKIKQQNFKVLYTIARAKSYGMNITFSKLGYTYGGTLFNNTNISGNIEHMNVWYKEIK